MLSWLTDHVATIVISLVLVLIVTAIVVNLVKGKKKWKHSCGGNCGCCPMRDPCHKQYSGSRGDVFSSPRLF